MDDDLAVIQRDLKAPKDKTNSFGGYVYRNAESILRAFKDVQPEGVALTMSDSISFIGERLFLVSTVRLWRGDKMIGEAQGAAMHALQKKGMDDAQITGACSSYARKYALCGLFAIDDSAEDPDGKDNNQISGKAPAYDPAPHVAAIEAAMSGQELRQALRANGCDNDHPAIASARVARLSVLIKGAQTVLVLDQFAKVFAPDWPDVEAVAATRRAELSTEAPF